MAPIFLNTLVGLRDVFVFVFNDSNVVSDFLKLFIAFEFGG